MFKQVPRILTPLRSSTLTSRYTTASSKSRIYDSIRNEFDFHTTLLLTTTAGTPFITLWTTSYCASCQTVKPLLKDIVEARDGIGFAEIELDAPGMGELGYRYLIKAVPTLLVFVRGEAEDRLVDLKVMRERESLEAWVGGVAERGGGSGKGWMSGLFGG